MFVYMHVNVQLEATIYTLSKNSCLNFQLLEIAKLFYTELDC